MVQVAGAVKNGSINLEAMPEIIKVLLAFQLMKSLEQPMEIIPEKRKQITEAVYDFVKQCPFEQFFGNMTVVILGAIVQRYLRTCKTYRQMFRIIDGQSHYTFWLPTDEEAIKVLPFLDAWHSRIASDTWEAFQNISTFIYTIYDAYGEG